MVGCQKIVTIYVKMVTLLGNLCLQPLIFVQKLAYF